MKLYKPLLLLCSFSFSFSAWAVPLGDLLQNEELLIESSELGILPYKALLKEERPASPPKNEISSDVLFKQPLNQETSLNKEKGLISFSKDKQIIASEDTDFYLFEQEELDAQQPGLGIYETLAPMLSSEMKKDAKKVWVETADFREAVNFLTMESDSKELILQKSSTEVTLLKGKALEEMLNKNLPPDVYDNKESDKTMVRALFDDFYDLLKNAFLIIAGVLILGKIISVIVIKVIAASEKPKNIHARRRHSKRHRKKRRRTYA